MRKCERCDIEMVPARYEGQVMFGDLNFVSDYFLHFTDGTKEVKKLTGGTKEKPNKRTLRVNTAVCTQCGKVEQYVGEL